LVAADGDSDWGERKLETEIGLWRSGVMGVLRKEWRVMDRHSNFA